MGELTCLLKTNGTRREYQITTAAIFIFHHQVLRFLVSTLHDC